MDTEPKRTRRLTPDQRDRIVELKLNRWTNAAIARAVGCQTRTVHDTWRKWLADTAAERAEALELTREELIQRQEQIAVDARLGAIRARELDRPAVETRFLAEERAALHEIARLAGVEAAARLELAGRPLVSVVSAVEAWDALHAGDGPA